MCPQLDLIIFHFSIRIVWIRVRYPNFVGYFYQERGSQELTIYTRIHNILWNATETDWNGSSKAGKQHLCVRLMASFLIMQYTRIYSKTFECGYYYTKYKSNQQWRPEWTGHQAKNAYAHIQTIQTIHTTIHTTLNERRGYECGQFGRVAILCAAYSHVTRF